VTCGKSGSTLPTHHFRIIRFWSRGHQRSADWWSPTCSTRTEHVNPQRMLMCIIAWHCWGWRTSIYLLATCVSRDNRPG
jgi:hypothetical protein